jgi:hypothetical protein
MQKCIDYDHFHHYNILIYKNNLKKKNTVPSFQKNLEQVR